MEAMSALDGAGVAAVAGVLEVDRCTELSAAVGCRGTGRAGSRNLLDLPSCQRLATTLKAHPQVGPFLPRGAVAVQCTLFDKSADNNWLVALHQDLSIPVQDRV